MKTLSIYLFFACFLVAFSAWGETSFSVIPPRGAEAGRDFKVTFRLENGDANEPRVGEILGCKFLYGPARSTSHSFVINNGQQSSTSTIDFTYTYVTDSAGVYTIPGASISVSGKILRTNPVKFEVYPSNRPSGSSGSNKTNPNAQGNFNPLSTGSSISKDDVFIRMIPSRTSVYEQEPIECTIKLYTKYRQIQNFKAVSQPNFDGCLIEEIPVQPALDDVEEYKGQTYSTAILKKVIIFPQKSGHLKLNSGKYDITVTKYERINSFFGPQLYPVGEEEIHVNPGDLNIDVKALPVDQPLTFNGAVGNFNFSSHISNNNLRTNEAATLTYTISGTGNIRYIKEPVVDFPSEFEQYTPKTETNAHISGNNVSGTMTIEYTFVPQVPGDYTIPGNEFAYFDPSSRSYVTVPIPEYQVKVARGAGVSANVANDQIKLEAKMTDILHIRQGVNDLKINHTLLVYSGLYWVIIGCLIILFCGFVIVHIKREQRNADITGQKVARASKVAKKRLKNAQEALALNDDGERFYQEILSAIWGYLSDKLSIAASQLSRQNISEKLTERNIPQNIIDNVIGLLDQCEMARYTPGSSSMEHKKNVLEQTEDIMSSLQKYK